MVLNRWRNLCPSCFDVEAEKASVRYSFAGLEAQSRSDRPPPRNPHKRRRYARCCGPRVARKQEAVDGRLLSTAKIVKDKQCTSHVVSMLGCHPGQGRGHPAGSYPPSWVPLRPVVLRIGRSVGAAHASQPAKGGAGEQTTAEGQRRRGQLLTAQGMVACA